MKFENLKKLRERLGMTQEEFATSLGLSKTTYNNYETGARDPKSGFWKEVADKYNVSSDYLLGRIAYSGVVHGGSGASIDVTDEEYDGIKQYRDLSDDEKHAVNVMFVAIVDLHEARSQPPASNVIELELPVLPQYPMIELPLASQALGAGLGEPADLDMTTDIVPVRLTEATRRADFLFRINGRSMEPGIPEGSLVAARRANFVDEGEIGIFLYNNEYYIKRKGPTGLESDNPKFGPLVPGEFGEVHCVGEVLGVVQ